MAYLPFHWFSISDRPALSCLCAVCQVRSNLNLCFDAASASHGYNVDGFMLAGRGGF